MVRWPCSTGAWEAEFAFQLCPASCVCVLLLALPTRMSLGSENRDLLIPFVEEIAASGRSSAYSRYLGKSRMVVGQPALNVSEPEEEEEG